MKVSLTTKAMAQLLAEVVVFFVDEGREFFQPPDETIAALSGEYLREVKGKRIRQEMLITPPDLKFRKVKPSKVYYFYAPSLNKFYSYNEALKISANRCWEYATNMGYGKILFLLNAKDGAESVDKIIEGILLGAYHFKKYKSDEEKTDVVRDITLCVKKSELSVARQRVDRTATICEILNQCREVVNEPPDKIFPASLAKIALNLAKKYKFHCQIMDEGELKRQGYNGILTVGKGSQFPPRMVIMKYRPTNNSSPGLSKKHLCLIGKGVTYDTGGVCLKPGEKMWEMKADMAGAAVVIFAMGLFAKLKPALTITAIAPLVQNAISERAALPGEIIKTPSGKTIHLQNTDAEGRLILVDALHYADKIRPTHILDVATLTGSIIRALGTSLSGLFANDLEFAEQIISAGKEVGEDIWQMPLYDEYRELLKSEVADIENVSGSPNAGAITAALFLREFVPKGVSWAHLDIAGTTFAEKKWKYYAPGATGYALKTLLALAQRI